MYDRKTVKNIISLLRVMAKQCDSMAEATVEQIRDGTIEANDLMEKLLYKEHAESCAFAYNNAIKSLERITEAEYNAEATDTDSTE